jgi:uncharacterized membrane protein YbaN (DUF454 family)
MILTTDQPLCLMPQTMPQDTPNPPNRARWQRGLWLACGAVCLLTGLVGLLLPLLPTTPFVLLAAYCFSQGSTRYEQWLLAHPRFGPMVRDWRGQHAVPLRAKQLAWVMMAASSALAVWWLPGAVAWIPGACCTLVAIWLWRLPTAAPQA